MRWGIRTELRVCPQGLIPQTSALRSLASGGMVCNPHPAPQGRSLVRLLRQTRSLLTFCLDLEGCPHQSKEGGVEGDGAVAVEGHVHAHQALHSKAAPVTSGDTAAWQPPNSVPVLATGSAQGMEPSQPYLPRLCITPVPQLPEAVTALVPAS